MHGRATGLAQPNFTQNPLFRSGFSTGNPIPSRVGLRHATKCLTGILGHYTKPPIILEVLFSLVHPSPY